MPDKDWIRKFEVPEGSGPYTIGELIENECVEQYVNLGGVKPDSSKALADVIYDGKYIDIKSRNIEGSGGGNLISMQRVFESQDKTILYKIFEYKKEKNIVYIMKEDEYYLHEIDWKDLCIINQGQGMLCLNKFVKEKTQISKDEWYKIARDTYHDWCIKQSKYFLQLSERVKIHQLSLL